MPSVALPAGFLRSVRIQLSLFFILIAGFVLPASMRAQASFAAAQNLLASGFQATTGIAIDGNGNVYVSDAFAKTINEIVAVNGKIPASATVKTLASGFGEPFNIAIDGSGNIYVADLGAGAIKEILAVNGAIPDSPTVVTLATADSGFNEPYGVVVDASGDVFFTASGPGFMSNGVVMEILAVNGVIPATPTIVTLSNNFFRPSGIAVDATGNVYVGNFGDSFISEFVAVNGSIPASPTILQLGSGLDEPSSIAVDGSGNVYVADNTLHTIVEMLAVNGSIPASPTILSLGSVSIPWGVAFDNAGNVYASDANNNVVSEIFPTASFGSVSIGATSSTISVVFDFSGSIALGSTAVLTTGVSSLDFTDAGTGSCTANSSYTAGQSCTVDVQFTPAVSGLRRGAVELLDGSGNVFATAYVQGIGSGPQVAFGPGIKSPMTNGLGRPVGVAVDAADNVYVSDTTNKAVYRITTAGARSTVASGLQLPGGVTVDGAGNVYFADTDAGTVSMASPSGAITVLTSGLPSPVGLTVDGQGDLYVANAVPPAVYKIAPNGTQTTVGGGFSEPIGVALDSAGNLYITDQNSDGTGAVYEVSTAGVQTTYDANFLKPAGIAVDAAGEVFVVDAERSAVIEVLNGVFAGNVANSFCGPLGVAAGDSGNVFVADTCAHSVVELDRNLPSISFQNTAVTYTSIDSPMTIDLINIGNQTLDMSAVSYPADFPEKNGVSSSCTGTTTINPGHQCEVPIQFSPLSVGLLSESVTLTDNALNASGTIQSIGVSGTGLAQVVTHFSVAGSSPVTAGAPFTFFVTALDSSNHTVAGYTGTVHFSSTDPLAALPADATLSSGLGSFQATLNPAGTQTISATDTVNPSATGSAGFQVNPGAAAHFGITAPSSAYVGGPVSFSVTAYDAEGNVATGYAGTVQFTSSDLAAVLPSPSTLIAGVGTFSATFMTAGSQTITGTDSITSAIVGTSSAVSVTIPNLVVTTASDDTSTASNCTPQSTPGTGTDANCSLRDGLAFAAANGSASITFDSVAFAASNSSAQNTIILSNGALTLPANTSIIGSTTGSGATLANLVTISGNNASSVFTVNSGVASIANLIVVNGTGSNGGGIGNGGTLTVANSTLAGNSSSTDGGAIYNTGTLTLNGVTVSGNSSGSGNGGGVYSTGALTVTNSTFSANTASVDGGAIFASANASLTNSTISANSAGQGGGVFTSASLTLANSVVAGNTASSFADVSGALTDNGGNQAGIDPSGTSTIAINLAPLANYGGPTQTMIPQPGSPAICAAIASNFGSLTTDQRGLALDSNCASGAVDAGAVQSNYSIAFSTEPPASVSVSQAISPAPVVQLSENGVVASAATGTVTMTDSATLLGGTTSTGFASGLASFSSLNLGSVTSNDTLTATLALNTSLNITATSTAVSAAKQTPAITWNAPVAIPYGTALSGTQLNASSPVAGAFVYTPASGAVLTAGSQTLSVTFTPTDTNDYTNATTTVQLTVNQATPSITWAQPAPIAYGTALSGTELNASSAVAGTFAYTPAASTVLSAGPQTLSVVFTPTDTTDYTTANASVNITVDQQASLTAPANGSVLSGSSAAFSWTVGGGVSQYELWLGTTGIGSSNIYNSGAITGTSVSPTGLPTNGVKLYTRLWSMINGVWQATDYVITEAGTPSQASLTSPAPSSALPGTNVTFSWTPGSGPTQYQLWLSSIGLGLSEVFNSGALTSTSVNVPNVPANGVVLYARMWSKINGVWQSTDYTFTESGSPTLAALTSPAPSGQLPGANVTFSWSAGAGPTSYELWLGTTGIGSANLYNSGTLSGTTTSASVTNLPTNGVTIYARMWSKVSGVWQSIDYTYTEFGTASQAVLTSPAPGTTLTGANVTFSWTTGTGPTQYELWLSSTGIGLSELYNSGAITATSASPTGLPTVGVKIYARLWSRINNGWQSTDYTYTEFGTPAPAALTSPAPSSVLSGGNITFSWSAGVGPSQYELWLGTTGIGSSNIYNSNVLSSAITSANVPNLPTNGVTLYARMWSKISGVWQAIDYTFTESGSPTLAVLTSPAPGSQLSGANVTFSWTAGGGPTRYELWLGTTGIGSSDLYNSGVTTATSVNPANLPTNGVLVYARVWSYVNGKWLSNDYTVTEFGATSQAVLTTPAPGSVLSGANVTFSWTPGSGPVAYELWLGSTGLGSSNLYNSGSITATSANPTNLPTNGSTIYARLWSRINNAWQATDYKFTAQ